ncbi:hypothetical protein ACK3BE_32410 (plasmid) [Pseudomonas mandelii]|uniref:hypothetical protein n=1 Tax=Pseudomonas mandelii TaxID=75612 RepID=UPI00398CE254
MTVLTPYQTAVYSEVSELLDEEGYGDLLHGQPVDVQDALAQMLLDANEMLGRAHRLQALLHEADRVAADTQAHDGE